MRECIQTDNPLISVVMAVYNPNMQWLREQLKSINSQTYRPLELIICDDCSTTVTVDDIRRMAEDCVTSIRFVVEKNESNIKSNKTFERLTKEAKGDYIAYCDQDDIWKPNKIEVLYDIAQNTGAILVCSDVCIIDENGNETAKSITKVRKRHKMLSGENLTDCLLYRNFVMGCTSLIKSETAKSAIPFPENMVHDHWLALFASVKGRIEYCKEPLINYRIHGNNQTLVLSGVNTKDDYYKIRIQKFCDRVSEINNRLNLESGKRAAEWANARINYFNKEKNAFSELWKLRKADISTSLFEIIMLRMPDFLFKMCIAAIKKGIV